MLYIAIFTETLSNFIIELKNNILDEISKNNSAYIKLKTENDQRLVQLQSLVSPILLEGYVETQYAIASFEITYSYLRGMRDKNKPDKVSPTSEEFSQELNKYETYRQSQYEASIQHNELIAVLSSEYRSMLIQYVEYWNTILELEKHYCYSGGMNDKAMLEEQLNLTVKNSWESFIALFL